MSRTLSDRTGFELLRELNVDPQKLTATMIYAYKGFPGDGAESRALGVDAYLSGSLDMSIIEATFIKMLTKEKDEEMITRFNLSEMGEISLEEGNGKLKILVVDDNPINKKVATKLMSTLGHHIIGGE